MRINARSFGLLCIFVTNFCFADYKERQDLNLYIAAMTNNVKLAQKSLDNGADVDTEIIDGLPVLNLAIMKRSQDVAKLLIAHHADLDNPVDILIDTLSEERTPLVLAMSMQNRELVEDLLKAGVDTTDANIIHYAILYGFNAFAIELMRKHIYGVQACFYHTSDHDCDGNSPLHTAICVENYLIIDWLLEHGADVNDCNCGGYTPLHVAVVFRNKDMILKLIAMGATTDSENYLGYTPLHLAANLGFIEEIKKLFDCGLLDIDMRNSLGQTALYCAVMHNAYTSVKTLIELGANVNIANNFGLSPIVLADIQCNSAIQDLLIQAGASPNYKVVYDAETFEQLADNSPEFLRARKKLSRYLLIKDQIDAADDEEL